MYLPLIVASSSLAPSLFLNVVYEVGITTFYQKQNKRLGSGSRHFKICKYKYKQDHKSTVWTPF